MPIKDQPHSYPINEFKSGEAWRLFKIMGEFVEGFDTLYPLGPAVSIFGSARVAEDHEYFKLTVETAKRFGQAGYAVITGGGPGLMRAANQGASQAHADSVGLNIKLPFEEEPNPYANIQVDFHYFFVRKVMFLKHSKACVIMPGGFGTLDEAFETITLIQTRRIKQVPVILFGRRYWEGLVQWVRDRMVDEAMISESDMDLFHLVDTPEEAVKIVTDFYGTDSKE